jgi:hypothetical protein
MYDIAIFIIYCWRYPNSRLAVSVTPARLFVFASVSALSYAVASRGISFLFYRPRSLAVSGSGAFYLFYRKRDPPGIF